MEKTKNKNAVAKLNYLKIAPRKVRRVATLIKKMGIVEAESELLYRPERAAKALLKLLRSAINNAANLNLDKERLYISDIRVDQGPMLKRYMPRAMGRATPIHKKMSHVYLNLEERKEIKPTKYKAPVAKITKSEKRVIKEKAVKEKEKPKIIKEIPSKKAKGGFMRKIFRRKEIA